MAGGIFVPKMEVIMNFILVIIVTILLIVCLIAWFFLKVTISAFKMYMERRKYSLPTDMELRRCIELVFKNGLW